MKNIAPQLVNLLSPAYRCRGFDGPCESMRWEPEAGHIPRGYAGAFGRVGDVRLVLCIAEPGNPKSGRDLADSGKRPAALINQMAVEVAGAFSTPASDFHRNVRFLLDLCWPDLDPDEQFMKTWITETVLCSASVAGGSIRRRVETECAGRYLKHQIQLFQNAFWIALGVKAEERIRRAGWAPNATARAAGRPIGKRVDAENEWRAAARAFHRWLAKSQP